MTFLLLLLVMLPSAVTVDVDVIELNHVYCVSDGRDEEGKPIRKVSYIASYWLFWESGHVRDWVKDGPATTLTGDTLIVVAKKRLFWIRGKVVTEIASPTDRERDDSQVYPIAKRRLIEGLRR